MNDRGLERQLRTTRVPEPPADLADRLEQGIPPSFRHRAAGSSGMAWMIAKVGVTMASVLVLAWVVRSLLPGSGGTGTSVAAMLEPVARATGSAQAVHIVMRVWSRNGEPFGFVDPGAEPQTFEAWIEVPGAGDKTGRGRITKEDRAQACDGRETVTFLPARGEAFRSAGCAVEVETFWPAAWVAQLQTAALSGGSEVRERAEGGGTARLLLREPGVQVAGRRPAFLQEFERETEITWSTGDRRLLGLRRWVIEDGRRPIAETVLIEYLDAPQEGLFKIELPPEVRWVTLRNAPEALASLGPREVARRFLEAAVAGDRDTLELLGASPRTAEIVAAEGVSAVLSVGEPFRTGAYGGVYVPYAIRYDAGGRTSEKRHKLALRDDNPQKRWVFDGGF